MKGKWIPLVWAMVVALAITDAAAQDEQWLSYRSGRNARSMISDLGSQQLKVTTGGPQGVELPKFKSGQPLFAKWVTPMAPAGYVWLALDRNSRRGPYDILYIDSNVDGSLKDQTPITSWSRDQYRSNFGPVAVVFPGKDGPITYHLNIEFYNYGGSQNSARVTTACWYEGQITVDGVKRDCMLVDYNANGAFDDKSLDQQDADRVRLRKDRDKWDAPFVGNFIPIDEKIYRLEVARDGAYIKLAEVTGLKFGRFRIPAGIAKITFGGENGRFVFHNSEVTGQLPVGRYRIVDWAIEQKDEKGRAWRILAYGWNDKGILDIEEFQERSLPVGWPIISKVEVQQSGKSHRLSHSFAGQLDEQFDITCDGKQPPAPKVRITNADKSYNRLFSLEYG